MQVRFHATLRPIVGGRSVSLDTGPGQTIGQLLEELLDRWPDLRPEMVDSQGHLLRRISIMLNGRNILHLDGTDTVIPQSANIDIFPPVGGG